MKSSAVQRASMIAALGVISGFNDCFPTKNKKRSKPVKECAECGIDHDHNNSFCSAECCKLNKIKG